MNHILFTLNVLLVCISSNGDSHPKGVVQPKSETKIKGVCWVAGDSIGQHNINPLLNSGVTWISQTPFGWMNGHQDPTVEIKTNRVLWGETDLGLGHTTCLAREKGIKTILKPHLWIRNSQGKWRSEIEMKSETEWNQWFETYETFILHYAKLAETHQIEALCIGTELRQTVRQHPKKWRKIIAQIRKTYSGKLTYAANWYKEFEEVSFWDDLDFIGIQGYFPLASNSNPSKQQLIRSWKKHKRAMERISKKFNRPIVLTEIGYKNTADAAIEPWSWPQRLDQASVVLSEVTQRRCYEAMFEALWEEEWLKGIFIWKWFHSSYRFDNLDSYFAERMERRKRRANYRKRANNEVFFTPQRKPALSVMNEWYLNR